MFFIGSVEEGRVEGRIRVGIVSLKIKHKLDYRYKYIIRL